MLEREAKSDRLYVKTSKTLGEVMDSIGLATIAKHIKSDAILSDLTASDKQ